MKRYLLILTVILGMLCTAHGAIAQSELVLSIHRDFGYGGFDNKIKGLFSLTATGPENLTGVGF